MAWGVLVAAGVVALGPACGGGNGGEGAGAGDGGKTSTGLEGGTLDGGDTGTGSADSGMQHDATSDADGGSKPQDAASEPAEPVEAGPFVSAPHPPWPLVAANGGVVLDPMKLVTVVSTGDPQASDFFAFGDQLIASAWWGSFSTEYGLGTPSASVHVTGPAITANLDGAQMQSYIASAIAGTPAAAADGQTMYMLYLPAGIDIIDDQTKQPNTNCQYYGGYHTTYDKSGDAWGVGQHCPLTGTGLTDLQWMTIVGSHEIAEAATDPIPDNGYTLVAKIDTAQPWTQSPWVAAVYGEVGDMCVSTQITEGSYTYQRIWSNTAAAQEQDPCVPPYANDAYVNASAPQGWYTMTVGGSVDIPVTGWSDRATSDWIMEGAVWTSNTSASSPFQVTTTSPTVYPTDAGDYPTTNNGKVSTLTVSAPGAPSGSWAVIALYSEPLVQAGDPYHLWFVGVYIP
jgi:hypothetical protein